jgi:deazaflavin-dependent oxidoreductase (nitroreductase family)
MWKIGLGKAINIWPAGIGRIMVIKHHGRKSGKEYFTPVNYATVDGEIYCMVGFGAGSDWYRNILVSPRVELWLPEGRHLACADEISDSPRRVFLLRQVLIASGFAAPMFGIDPRKLDDEELAAVSKVYHLVHFRLEGS